MGFWRAFMNGKRINAIPLSLVRVGQRVKILYVAGGYSMRCRLAQMGIYPGVVVSVEMKYTPGPIVLRKDSLRVGIGAGMANRIMVQVIG